MPPLSPGARPANRFHLAFSCTFQGFLFSHGPFGQLTVFSPSLPLSPFEERNTLLIKGERGEEWQGRQRGPGPRSGAAGPWLSDLSSRERKTQASWGSSLLKLTSAALAAASPWLCPAAHCRSSLAPSSHPPLPIPATAAVAWQPRPQAHGKQRRRCHRALDQGGKGATKPVQETWGKQSS